MLLSRLFEERRWAIPDCEFLLPNYAKGIVVQQTLMEPKIAKYPKPAVSVTTGFNLVESYVITATSSGSEKYKMFCKRCACTLWTVPMHRGGTHFMVRTSLIENG